MISSLENLIYENFPHAINALYRLPEEEAIASLLDQIALTEEQEKRIFDRAHALVSSVRQQKPKSFSIETFLKTYDLDSQEGTVLMCLAEALLRIPDTPTKTKLIRDKISSIDWAEDLKKGDSFFMTLANIGLAASDKLLTFGVDSEGFLGTLGSISRKLTEPVIRQAIGQGMKILGYQFVMGETIEKALERAKSDETKGYRHSYDMLGEAAYTQQDADRYYHSYLQAIKAVGASINEGDIFQQPSISVKLSALHPRYDLTQRAHVLEELCPKVLILAQQAKEQGIGLTIDAEESERLLLSLEIIERVRLDPSLNDWHGFGLAVQAYQKRAPAVIDWIINLSHQSKHKICVRLVKGAYWDSEIKRSQEKGYSSYPVFTRKVYTDVSYLVCAKKMIAAQEEIYPQFATHNAQTLSAILEFLGNRQDFEFQRLHGMGEPLYAPLVGKAGMGIACRIYAPVGEYRDLLAYLVRRLLENGANTSFVNKILDKDIPIESMITNPIREAKKFNLKPHSKIPLPLDMLQPQRQNSKGIDLTDHSILTHLKSQMETIIHKMPWKAASLIQGQEAGKDEKQTRNPANSSEIIGHIQEASETDVEKAFSAAENAFENWTSTPVEKRAEALEKLASLLEDRSAQFMALLVKEGGKTLNDAVSEVREATDFCRYYAAEARRHLAHPLPLPGPTGETNQLNLKGRGIVVCISPWNFPLAIFLGQIAAALAAGNCVIAKPAQQTPLIAYHTIKLAHEAGIPVDVLQLLIGKGSIIGGKLVSDPRTAGVAFTGSTEVARWINKTLADRESPIAPLIAETGGINAMIVDSSALLEQVVQDVITSAFQSAGQRCSALRILYVQEDVAERFKDLLKGAMAELVIGNPAFLSTDVGPVIDKSARDQLQEHIDFLKKTAHCIYAVSLPEESSQGSFIAPQAWELREASLLTKEVFGPILHVVCFKESELPLVIQKINKTGYGLTLGVHSRINETINFVRQKAKVGNLYVNRNMIGAVVGVQPFGGEGLSGTGPKAGGPHYLPRFCVERTFTENTTASGGNASLLAIEE